METNTNIPQQNTPTPAVHLMDLFNRILIPSLREELKIKNEALTEYKAINWTAITAASQQQRELFILKKKLHESVNEIQNLKTQLSKTKSTLKLAESFIKGEDNINEMKEALSTSEISEFLKTQIYKQIPSIVPNLKRAV